MRVLFATFLQILFATFLQILFASQMQILFATFLQILFADHSRVEMQKLGCTGRNWVGHKGVA